MIEFKYTWLHKEIVGYQNHNAETVRTYRYEDFEDWCIEHKIDEGTDVEQYIDKNWNKLTEDFYHFKNPNEFKSNNTYSQTQSIL